MIRKQVYLSLLDARVRIGVSRREYNQERLPSSLGYKTPVEFATDWQPRPAERQAYQLELEFMAVGD